MAKRLLPLDVFIRRLRVLPCKSEQSTEKKKLIFLSELVGLGYEPQNTDAYNDSILKRYKTTMKTLKELKGGHVDYTTLFKGFPEEVPPEDEYFVRRLIGYVGNYFGMFSEGTGPELENGMTVPEWLFNVEMFGANPITQFQDEKLYKKAVANQKKRKKDSHHVLHPIKFVSDEEAMALGKQWLQDVFYAKSSVKDSLKADVEKLLRFYGNASFIDFDKVTFLETKTYLLSYFWKLGQLETVSSLVSSPTDLLRLFANLTGGDISLAEKIKFPKLTSQQRKMVLRTLDRFSNLEESLNRYRDLWLVVGRGLHPMAYEKRFPNVAGAFDALRNTKIRTWNGKVEMAMKAPSSRKNLLNTLAILEQRPTEFARKLHRVLRDNKRNIGPVLASFEKVAHRVPLKILFTLETYFAEAIFRDNRSFINKKGRLKIIENTQELLTAKTRDNLKVILEEAIKQRITENKESWSDKKVWIDPQLNKFVAPFSQRKTSEALISAGRGTRIPLDDSKVLRVFVYWKEKSTRTDLDLSLIAFDENMEFVEQVSYTRLATNGITHSGDLQSAPHGAAEFIDVTFNALKKNIAYIAPQVYKYRGESFDQCEEAFVGWMSRDKATSSYKTFDVKTVENAFQLSRSSAYAVPFLVDLQEKEVVYVDFYNGSGVSRYNRVENSLDSVSTILKESAAFVDTKPNIHRLATTNASARGAEVVEDKEEADITIGVRDCTYNAREIESILSEFLA